MINIINFFLIKKKIKYINIKIFLKKNNFFDIIFFFFKKEREKEKNFFLLEVLLQAKEGQR
jgi:hypothetical protein